MNYQNTFTKIDLYLSKAELKDKFLNDQMDMDEYLSNVKALDELLGMIA
jgi:hypothetical protein